MPISFILSTIACNKSSPINYKMSSCNSLVEQCKYGGGNLKKPFQINGYNTIHIFKTKSFNLCM